MKSKKKEAPFYAKNEVIELPTKRYCTRQLIKHALMSPLQTSTSCLEKAPLKRAYQFSDSEESEDSQPLVRRRRRRLQEGEVLDSGNNQDLVHKCDMQLEESLNLKCEDSSSDFDDDGLKFLEVKPLTVDTGDSILDLPQFDFEPFPPKGELSTSLICHSSLEMGKETCIKSLRMGECLAEIGTDDSLFHVNTAFKDVPELETSNAQNVVANKYDYQGNKFSAQSFPSELFLFQNLIKVIPHIPRHIAFGCFVGLSRLIGFSSKDIANIFGETAKKIQVLQGHKSSVLCKVEVPHNYHSSHGVLKPCIYIDDITRGEERVKISLEDGRDSKDLPTFFYIPHSLVYKNAYVKFSLARMSDEGFCSHCHGDCLTAPVPCVCVTETGGQFAYTPGGLVTEKFLEECISLKREPKQHHYFYCRNCPLERSKDEKSSVGCKGHLLLKFIKECWFKCGCNKSCRNRIVQQGITAKLQASLSFVNFSCGPR